MKSLSINQMESKRGGGCSSGLAKAAAVISVVSSAGCSSGIGLVVFGPSAVVSTAISLYCTFSD